VNGSAKSIIHKKSPASAGGVGYFFGEVANTTSLASG